MKKIISIGLVIICLVLLATASSSRLMEIVAMYIPSPLRYGDLYLYSSLKKFKEQNETCPVYTHDGRNRDSVNLYILGDSYTRQVDPANFHFNNYYFCEWRNQGVLVKAPASDKKNVLVIESVERYFRGRLNYTITDKLIFQAKDEKEESRKNNQGEESIVPEKYFRWQANDNLDYLLDYSDFALFFKEIKAAINYYAFNKLDNRVSLSPDNKFIFYRETTDSNLNTSSFNVLRDSEIDTIIHYINEAYDYYKKSGFDDVCLAIVPNSVSINAPGIGKYNHLVERIQKHPELKIPFIDIYSEMVKDTVNNFCTSDGHWNCRGKNIFLKAVHEKSGIQTVRSVK